MCGIVGAIALTSDRGGFSEPLARIVERMALTLTHRGPDGAGLWQSPSGAVALAHRRLAIIDLTETGRQPMGYGDRFWVTFNGELYNFRDLRSQLHGLGHAFKGESDTEVLLAAVAQWGIDEALRRCIGMFAFALWDEQERVMHLARDRIGEKPLYLEEHSGHLFFSSEVRAFRTISGPAARISADATNAYLRDGCVPGALSIYEGIYKLPPGHLVTIRALAGQRLTRDWPQAQSSHGMGTLTSRRYWSCRDIAKEERGFVITDEQAAIDQGEELLRQAVRMQMRADVPIGAFLSGGIDSSLVTALMQSQSPRPVRTFTVAFDDARYDESHHARAIATYLGTNHEEFVLREQEIVDQIPSIVHRMDEPTANGSFFPVYLISRLARSQVTVTLSGDGGDELFAGYNRYVLAPTAWRRTRWLPTRLRRQIARRLTSSRFVDSLFTLIGNRAGFGSQVASADTRRKLARILAATTFREAYESLTSWWVEPAIVECDCVLPSREWPDAFIDDLQSMLLADQINYLPDDNLAKVDRASMAASLETRLPLLDHRIVEFSWRLPARMKLRDSTTKWLLRSILYRYVPRHLIERPKMGFSIPTGRWLRGPLREWAADMLGSSAFGNGIPIRRTTIRRLWADYLAGHGPSDNEIWALVMLAAWAASRASFPDSTQPYGIAQR